MKIRGRPQRSRHAKFQTRASCYVSRKFILLRKDSCGNTMNVQIQFHKLWTITNRKVEFLDCDNITIRNALYYRTRFQRFSRGALLDIVNLGECINHYNFRERITSTRQLMADSETRFSNILLRMFHKTRILHISRNYLRKRGII